MVNTIRILLTGSILLLSAITVLAQPQEGSITYRIDLDGIDPETKSMMQNMTMTMTFKEKKSRVDMDMGMIKNSTITNGDITYSLMDYMGSKFKIPMSNEDVKNKKMDEANYDIEYTKETKQIAGYTCKKAIIKTKDKNVFNIWFTDAIFPNASQQTQYTKFQGGCPLEFDMAQNGMKMKLTATKVNLGSVSDKVFEIPDGYQEVTFDQLMQMMGGMKPKN